MRKKVLQKAESDAASAERLVDDGSGRDENHFPSAFGGEIRFLFDASQRRHQHVFRTTFQINEHNVVASRRVFRRRRRRCRFRRCFSRVARQNQ